jgi:AmmeMemoRadiSam system protein B
MRSPGEAGRPAVWAGRFYPADPAALAAEVARRIGDPAGARPAIGAMAPHAGYVYSGGIAGRTFARVAVPAEVVVIAPNHTGAGPAISVLARGSYRMPGADVPIAEPLARAILAEHPRASEDAAAHAREHAIEVELPFLVARRPDVAIVPIVLGPVTGAEAEELGRAVARATRGRDVLVVASSDMSHFLPEEATRALDALALAPLLALDAAELLRVVRGRDITMCGVLPAAAMLAFARERGARAAELAGYTTSAEASGDAGRVVGYAGVVVT